MAVVVARGLVRSVCGKRGFYFRPPFETSIANRELIDRRRNQDGRKVESVERVCTDLVLQLPIEEIVRVVRESRGLVGTTPMNNNTGTLWEENRTVKTDGKLPILVTY